MATSPRRLFTVALATALTALPALAAAQRTAPPGSTSTGSTATSRPDSTSSSSGSSSSSSGSSGSNSSGSSSTRSSETSSFGRSRGDRPALGVATPRADIDINGISIPLRGSWGRFYPSYPGGFGWNLGYVNYNPWYYGNTRWIWGWDGLWYDPFDPYGYGWYGMNPYGYSYGYPYSSDYYRRNDHKVIEHRGSIRLRVKPKDAKVLVDGTLVGVVDDFDGFSNHLDLAAGTHTLEIRANGYKSFSGTINVIEDRTLTERISLKK